MATIDVPDPLFVAEVLETGVGEVVLGVEQDAATKKADASALRLGSAFPVTEIVKAELDGIAGGEMLPKMTTKREINERERPAEGKIFRPNPEDVL